MNLSGPINLVRWVWATLSTWQPYQPGRLHQERWLHQPERPHSLEWSVSLKYGMWWNYIVSLNMSCSSQVIYQDDLINLDVLGCLKVMLASGWSLDWNSTTWWDLLILTYTVAQGGLIYQEAFSGLNMLASGRILVSKSTACSIHVFSLDLLYWAYALSWTLSSWLSRIPSW